MAVKKEKHKMPEQKPKERIKNFKEVPFGYTKEIAIEEAKRCLQCKNKPCMEGCPVEIDIPGFIQCIANGEFDKAIAHNRACLLKERDILLKRRPREPEELRFVR